MLFVLPVATLTVTGLFLVVRAAFCAPQGEEDQHGFHFTAPDENAAPRVPVVSASDLLFFRQ